jgi:biopolymer transport protein ExbD
MTPLIDVVFLLLTFFLFSVVLMVRARVLDVALPPVGAALPGAEARAITIAIRANGEVLLEGQSIAIDQLPARLTLLKTEDPGLKILIAADEGGRSGDLLHLIDTLMNAGITDFGIVGKGVEDKGEASR